MLSEKHIPFFFLYAITFVLGLPSICYANAIAPFIPIFSSATYVMAAIVLVFIILFEAFIIKLFDRKRSFIKCMQVSSIINISSSIAGSLFVLVIRGDIQMWYLRDVTLPAFIITLMVEGPLLYALFKGRISSGRTVMIDMVMNIASYALLLIVLPILFVMTLSFWGGIDNKNKLRDWSDEQVFTNEQGYIYTIKHKESNPYTIERYDVQNKEWKAVDVICNGITPFDVSDNLLVCRTENDNLYGFTLYNTTDAQQVLSLNGKFPNVKISPSGKLIALLEDEGLVCEQKDEGSYYVFGKKTTLRVLDLFTGETIFEYPEVILDDGLAWSPDSNKLAFVSFRDKSLFIPTKEEMKGGTSYGRPDFHPKYVYVYDLKEKKTQELIEGTHPQFDAKGSSVLINKDKAAVAFYLESKKSEIIASNNNTGRSKYVWSPTNESLLVKIMKMDFFESTFLVVMNAKNPDKKFIISEDLIYSYDWSD